MRIISCNSARLGLVALLLLRVPACGPGDPGPALDLPARPDHAPGGEQLRDELGSLDPDAWEERIYAEVIQGNVPGWLRELQRVEMVGEVAGRQRQVTFWAAPDYLAVRLGSSGFDSERATGGVALYGWHLPAGEPIQPVFPVLVNRPPHFSLGIRLVARDVLVDGELHDLGEVLTDPDLADLLAATAPESRPRRPPRAGIPAGSASPGSARSSG